MKKFDALLMHIKYFNQNIFLTELINVHKFWIKSQTANLSFLLRLHLQKFRMHFFNHTACLISLFHMHSHNNSAKMGGTILFQLQAEQNSARAGTILFQIGTILFQKWNNYVPYWKRNYYCVMFTWKEMR